ncbi:hypothetical protein AMATHDRAFT_66224 [Amanita thiersii Skay4041]|uniref:Uncharacterized protein n=1 Tax=Amanita thiersii Skay4041 TaxID=703135 RepID=A0A2A9NK84_9AGAR|nr:hypothetical protein AMATHDRAFT_66224 [Amanita thiersii Skay4041]
MAGDILVSHPPAVKVGGRRLSLSSKHKQHSPTVQTKLSGKDSPVPDYPRPAAPGEEQQQHLQHSPTHEEESPFRKEKKHNAHDNEKKFKESSHWKLEATRPTRDAIAGNKAFGASGRIAQPAGKGLNA